MSQEKKIYAITDAPERQHRSIKQVAAKVGKGVLAVGTAVGIVGGAAFGIAKYEQHKAAEHAKEQAAVGKILDPVMANFDKQLLTDHAKDPTRFTLTEAGKTPDGMRAVKVTDTHIDTSISSAGDTSYNMTFAVMGTDKGGTPDPHKPLYFSSERASQDSTDTGGSMDTDSMLKMMAPGGESWGHGDGYDATGWQVQTSVGAEGDGYDGGGYFDTADPPAPLDAPTGANGEAIDDPAGLARLAVQQLHDNPPQL